MKIKGINPVPQKDACSCGYCAMCAIYNYYRIDKSGLRAYLGTDSTPLPCNLPYRSEIEKAISSVFPLFASCNGTLPHDMMAVLFKDGFKTRTAAEFDRGEIRAHLAGGHPVLALVSGFGHWVVISGIDDDGVWITDSLVDETYHEPDEEFVEDLNGLIFVERNSSSKKLDFAEMGNADFAREYSRATSLCAKMGYTAGKEYLGEKLYSIFSQDRSRQTVVGNWVNSLFGWKEVSSGTSSTTYVDEKLGYLSEKEQEKPLNARRN